MTEPTPNYGALAAEAFKAINAALSALFPPVEEPAKPTATWYPDGAEDLSSAVHQAIGSASVCWENMKGTGVFNDTQARAIAEGLIAWINDEPPGTPAPRRTLAQDIAAVLNRHSAENGSDTPDFILAEMLVSVLVAFDAAVLDRGLFYGHKCSVSNCDHGDGLA